MKIWFEIPCRLIKLIMNMYFQNAFILSQFFKDSENACNISFYYFYKLNATEDKKTFKDLGTYAK